MPFLFSLKHHMPCMPCSHVAWVRPENHTFPKRIPQKSIHKCHSRPIFHLVTSSCVCRPRAQQNTCQLNSRKTFHDPSNLQTLNSYTFFRVVNCSRLPRLRLIVPSLIHLHIFPLVCDLVGQDTFGLVMFGRSVSVTTLDRDEIEKHVCSHQLRCTLIWRHAQIHFEFVRMAPSQWRKDQHCWAKKRTAIFKV